MSKSLLEQYTVLNVTGGELNDADTQQTCDEAVFANNGVCYADCAGRLATFNVIMNGQENDDDVRTQVHVCPRISRAGTGYSGTLGAVVMHRDIVPSHEEVAIIADDTLSGW